MTAIVLLSRLIPSAQVEVRFDPPALVAAWKDWLDAHADALTFDAAKDTYVLQ
jgi:hypothetical protein